ncbi:MAG: non-canonical purine NTP pyrophosphatase [Candidatus Doudnabacteria bacterium]|nr:non-canonical purine NTP pyrophosphatase [Candidatus Doudnabacteria bacterium]
MIKFITGNANKFAEVNALMPGQVEQLVIDLPEIQDIDPHVIIRAKLQAAFEHASGQFMVEDVSLRLDCINGLPGPLIKWFLKAMGPDGIADIATKLGNNRAEAFVVIGYASNPEDIHFFEGSVAGTIVNPKVVSKFGWDGIFMPDGYDKTFAEMTSEEKNAISHRKIAVTKLVEFLNQ